MPAHNRTANPLIYKQFTGQRLWQFRRKDLCSTRAQRFRNMPHALNCPTQDLAASEHRTPDTAPHTAESLASTAAIVLAGSYAWTNSSFEQLRVRPLLPIAQSPMIVHVLRALGTFGVSDATICANGSTGALKAYFEKAPAMPIAVNYYEDKSPRGAAGCMRDAAQKTDADTLIVTECAILPDAPLADLVAHHRQTGAALTIAVSREERFGAAEFLNPTGLYIIDRRALAHIGAQGYQDIKENLIPQLHAAGERIETFETSRGCPNVLNAQSYLAANHWMIQRIVDQPSLLADESEYQRTGSVLVHNSASIDPTASLVGPVLVGPGVQIRAGAVIVGPTSIGAGTCLGRNVAVSRSVIWSDTRVGEGAVVDRSIVGDNASVPANASLRGAVQAPEPASRSSLRSWRRHFQVATHLRQRLVSDWAVSSAR